MYYELYIDVFFLENLLMDSLILLAVNRALKCGASLGRTFLGGALGSALTCLAIVVPVFPWIKFIVYYAGISSVMLLTGLGIKDKGQFVRGFLLLYLMAVILGGIMQLFRPYLRYVSLFYAAAGTGYLILTKLWEFLSIFQSRRERIVEVTLYQENGGSVTVNALLDTGNTLRDFVTGSPVSVLDPALAGRICDLPEMARGFHLIPYRCVSGDSLMKVFRIDKMCVHGQEGGKNDDVWILAPVLGIGEGPIGRAGEYEMILNPEMLIKGSAGKDLPDKIVEEETK